MGLKRGLEPNPRAMRRLVFCSHHLALNWQFTEQSPTHQGLQKRSAGGPEPLLHRVLIPQSDVCHSQGQSPDQEAGSQGLASDGPTLGLVAESEMVAAVLSPVVEAVVEAERSSEHSF